MDKTQILHEVIDVLAGRRNLSADAADEMHEALSPGYTTPPPTDEQVAAAQAVLDAQKRAADFAASQAPVQQSEQV